ncbi:VWA domain-containing protein [Arthrobacter sp. AL12]|uniref:vWA domain-containing protein n=1 Tax=Arthrobacter sp. AL12 TaxID=3042241 RepID=UPI00249B2766|nr:VWA domain-containing protein [Arthrobacter sp. AL12]MDI3211638.1 VWA domain-containing protein [Arthrobacter sp. AL12]
MELIFWWILPAAAGAVPAAWFLGRRRHRARAARRRPVAHSDRLTALPEYQAALRKHRNRLRLLAAAGTLLMVAAVVAAARPAERSTVRPEQHKRDIILCLDASGSMNSADAAVVDVFGSLARQFDGERIGLTIFDSSAVQVFPLTDDYDYVQDQLQQAKTAFDGAGSGSFLDGTWNGEGSSLIGDGLASCLQSFPAAPEGEEPGRRARSVILATDNFLSGTPLVTLAEAGALGKDRDVRIFALNPGDYDFGPDAGAEQPGARLRGVAEGSGGAYYALDSPDAVPGIVTGIEATQAAAVRGAPRSVVSDRAEVPLGVALLAGLVLAGASWRPRR